MGTPPLGSAFLYNGFIIFTVLLAAGIVWNVYLAGRGLLEPRRRTQAYTVGALVGVSLWMSLTWAVASTGIIADFDRRPPPIVLMLLTVLTISTAVAFTRYGTRFVDGLPLWILVAGQAFRFPLEWLMHRAADEGVMPPQMSYSGWNFDIVTGIAAIPVALLLARGFRHARTIAVAWNVLGSVLLINILTIAMLSTPLVAAFGSDRLNTWVAHPPYVWLPAVMVVCAITGHLVIFRKLRATATRRL
ncbi:MAG TPA: hypothetical protein VMO26_24215 [Vicinamibacterales bacterium]|nr:hypothetical protein [Vicinamibacterales bacterium]